MESLEKEKLSDVGQEIAGEGARAESEGSESLEAED